MNQIHTSYKVSKMLKEFLGEGAVEPMGGAWYSPEGMLYITVAPRPKKEAPAYRLEDVLSRPFCEAMAKKVCPIMKEDGFDIEDDWDIALIVLNEYQSGGLPAVCKALDEMMEGK